MRTHMRLNTLKSMWQRLMLTGWSADLKTTARCSSEEIPRKVFGDYASGAELHSAYIGSGEIYRRRMGRDIPQDLYISEYEQRCDDGYRSAGVESGERRRTDRTCACCRDQDGEKQIM